MSNNEFDPIVTLEIQPEGIIEGYGSGDEFWKQIWRFPCIRDKEGSKLTIRFGHKFFKYVIDSKNKRLHMRNKTMIDIKDMDSWSQLTGEIKRLIVGGKENTEFLMIEVLNVKQV